MTKPYTLTLNEFNSLPLYFHQPLRPFLRNHTFYFDSLAKHEIDKHNLVQASNALWKIGLGFAIDNNDRIGCLEFAIIRGAPVSVLLGVDGNGESFIELVKPNSVITLKKKHSV